MLAVNLAGEYFFLSKNDFDQMVNYSLEKNSDLFTHLKAKHIIAESLSEPAIELLSIKYRTKKDFLSDFTSLHMFIITSRCNQKCIYCHASSKDLKETNYDMSKEIAEKAVDFVFQSPSKKIKIEFQGGEPLLNFKTIKDVIEYSNTHAERNGKRVEFVVCTNLTLITDEMLKYFADNNVYISTSLDGPKHVHDFNRRYRTKYGSCYEDVIRGLEKTKKYLKPDNISALMTTTKHSLDFPDEIVDEYVNNDCRSIFIRSLNPFGYAKNKIKEIGYSAKEYIRFYKTVLEYIIQLNQKGIYLEEAFTSILLTRILTPFSTGFVDLQFPASTGISGVVYGHDGNVYPSDEARMLAQMGDYEFCMGNIMRNTYREIFNGRKIRNLIDGSCVESLPDCIDCAFQTYCGVDPIRNYEAHKDIIGNRISSDLCFIHKEIIKYLFEIILQDNVDIMDVFWSWLTGRHLSELKAKE